MEIYSHIKMQAVATSKRLASERGEAPDMVGTGHCFAHLLSVAPNASSAIILETSPSIEPWRANCFKQVTQDGVIIWKNKTLRKLLGQLGKDTDDTWKSIIENRGSVQHLDFLNDNQKSVFKTAIEIDQNDLIELAAQRQKYICQGQSLNLFFPVDVTASELHAIHLKAWQKGLKTLYYLRTEALKRAELISTKVEREIRNESEGESCVNCEG